MPLFQETSLLDAESVHVIIENQTNETENTEFEHLENEPAQDKLSEDSLVDTESGTDNETDNESESGSELEETTRSRRPLKNPELWKQNIRKRKRNAEDEYISCKGKKVMRRSINRNDCRCRFKCFQNVKEDDQQKIFRQYWSLGYGGQRDFISQYVKKETKAKLTTVRESRRKYTYQYFLENNDGRERVCKAFFLDTLSIGECDAWTKEANNLEVKESQRKTEMLLESTLNPSLQFSLTFVGKRQAENI